MSFACACYVDYRFVLFFMFIYYEYHHQFSRLLFCFSNFVAVFNNLLGLFCCLIISVIILMINKLKSWFADVWVTNGLLVAMPLFSTCNRSQVKSKCGKNKKGGKLRCSWVCHWYSYCFLIPFAIYYNLLYTSSATKNLFAL